MKDPEIKLFGRKIVLPENGEEYPGSYDEEEKRKQVDCEEEQSSGEIYDCRHLTISEALHASMIDGYDGFHQKTFKPNGTVLSFGPESPLCKSMASGLKIEDKNMPNRGLVSCGNGDNADDRSVGSSVKTSSSVANGGENRLQQPVVLNINQFQSPLPCIPGFPWQLTWNPAVPLPAIFTPPGFNPMSFYPSPYLNYGAPNSWNVPCVSLPPPTANQNTTIYSPSSPLGKHSRNGELLNPSNSEGEHNFRQNSDSSIVVPKSLRIDDPEEAAKSSIWATLGIKYDSTSRKGLFNALQPKCDPKESIANASPGLLQANPAALSRSINFQESV